MTVKLTATVERFAKRAPLFVAGLYALVGVLGVWRAVATLGAHVSFDPNEGWNAYHAHAAIAGRVLYPPAQSYFVNNYPPLSFYLVGAMGHIVRNNILAGRIVSLLSFFAIVVGVWKAARLMRCGSEAAMVGALFFAVCLLVGSDYVGMNDPELLAHALQIGALIVLLGAPERALAAAVLFVAALFVKHNLVAMPLAAAIWLGLYERKHAICFVVGGAATAVAGLVAFRVLYGSELLSELASARTYSFALLIENVQNWLVWGGVPTLIVGGLAFLRAKDKSVVLCAIYAALSIAIGVAFSGGVGVDANVFFDADIALALGICLAFDRLAVRGAWLPAAISAALLLPLALGLYSRTDEDWRDPDFWAHPLFDEAALSRSDIAFLKQHSGRALCETLALCYWAGKAPEVDAFNAGEAIATGAVSDAPLIQKIQSRAYTVIEFDTMEPFALGPRVHAAVLAAYRIDHANDDGVFLVPK